MTTPHEIELKLALPAAQAAVFARRMARRRTLEGSTPVQHDLLTRYFDTPGFDLSAEGVALRVRRVGRRWLQTLKTEGERQGGLSRRVEFEMPVRGDAPDWERFPDEALAYVPEALRDRLAPVFETRFHRTAWLVAGKGGAQIEVALDVGEVRSGERSQPICEIELELKAGQPDALFALALGWARAFDCLPFDLSKAERGVRLAQGEGAAPAKAAPLALDDGMSVEEAFAATCQACLGQFQANLPGVFATDDVETLHQARVALRRLRAALRLYRAACVLPDALTTDLRALADALGPARDWDVLCSETLPAIAPHYPDDAAWRRGVEALERRRAEVRATMHDTLLQAKPGAWLLAMQRWLLQRGWRASPRPVPEAQRRAQRAPLDAWARRALEKGHRRVERGARRYARLQPAQRHALRIAIKRQRYAVEFFQALFDSRRQARYLDALRDAQDRLGRSNDARIASGLLAAGPADAGAMRDFVLGWLAARQADGDGERPAEVRALLKAKTDW